MRIKKRSAVVLALAAAGALAVASIALASGTSTVTFKFTPSNVPISTFQNGQINVHTHTTYTGSTATDRAQLYFDSDFKVNTAAAPKCSQANISGKNMKDAMAACGSAKIGAGTATASGGIGACVLVFNALDADSNTAGNQPGVLLHTRASFAGPFSCANPATNTGGDVTVVLAGILKAANKPGYGKQLDFNHITGVSPFPLTDFNVTVKKGSFIAAKCSHTPKQWKLQTKFTYTSPASTQTVQSTPQTCT